MLSLDTDKIGICSTNYKPACISNPSPLKLPEALSQCLSFLKVTPCPSRHAEAAINTAPCKSMEPSCTFPSLAVPPLCLPAPTLQQKSIASAAAQLSLLHCWWRQTVGELNWLNIHLFLKMMISKFVIIDETVKYEPWLLSCPDGSYKGTKKSSAIIMW